MSGLLGFLAQDQPVLAAFMNASISRRAPIVSRRPQPPVVEWESDSDSAYEMDYARATSKIAPAIKDDGCGVGVSVEVFRAVLRDVKDPKATTTDVCQSVIMPRTQAAKCAYTDLLWGEVDKGGQPLLGPATVFVSHAWRYPFKQVAEVVIEYAEEEAVKARTAGGGRQPPPMYFWFDLFTNSQHDTSARPQEWWATTFRKQIGTVGRTLLILNPWNDPVPLTRAWCLWEILCTIQEKAEFHIRLPKDQRNAFRAALLKDFRGVLGSVVKMDGERAQAWLEADRAMIFKAVEETVSFNKLNTIVKDHLREWILSTGEALFDEVQREAKGPFAPAAKQEKLADFALPLGALCAQLGKYDRALELYTCARDVYHRRGKRKLEAVACLNAGLTYGNKGQPKKTIEMMQRALQLGMAKASDKANCSIALGNALLDQGDARKALQMFEGALETMKREHGSGHFKVAFAYSNVAVASLKLKDYKKAAKNYTQAMKIYEVVEGPRHPNTADAIHGLAVALLRDGNASEAVALEQRAVAAYRENYGDSHPFTKQAVATLASAQRRAAGGSAGGDEPPLPPPKRFARRMSICDVPQQEAQRPTFADLQPLERGRRRSSSSYSGGVDARRFSCSSGASEDFVRDRRRSRSRNGSSDYSGGVDCRDFSVCDLDDDYQTL